MRNSYVHRITTQRDFNDNIDLLVKSYSLPKKPPALSHDSDKVNNYLNALVPLLEDLCEAVSPKDTSRKPIYSKKDALLTSEIMLYFANTAAEFADRSSEDIVKLIKRSIVNGMLVSDTNSANKTAILEMIAVNLNTNILETNARDCTLTSIQNEYLEKASSSNLEAIYPTIANPWYNYDTLSNRNLESKPPSSRRLIFETFIKATDSLLSLNPDGSGLDSHSLNTQVDLYKYMVREWKSVKPLFLEADAIILKKHAQLVKLLNTNIEFDPDVKYTLHKLEKISGLFARDILGPAYDSSIKTAQMLNSEESIDFWMNIKLSAALDSYQPGSGLDFK